MVFHVPVRKLQYKAAAEQLVRGSSFAIDMESELVFQALVFPTTSRWIHTPTIASTVVHVVMRDPESVVTYRCKQKIGQYDTGGESNTVVAMLFSSQTRYNCTPSTTVFQ
jgi:hypothetical protein